MGQPSRILKLATALRALVTSGFWPLISVMSATAASSAFLSAAASPTPMFRVIFSSLGTAITLAMPSSSRSRGTTTSL